MLKAAFTATGLMTGAISSCMGAIDDSVAIESGPHITRQIEAQSFERLAVSGDYDVIVVPGASAAIEVEGPQNIIEHTEFRFEDGALAIRPEKRGGKWIRWSEGDDLVVRITSPGITAASIAGSGQIRLEAVEADRFDGSIAGSGELRIQQLTAKNAEFDISGSGDIWVEGSAEALDLEIAGSGGFENPGFRSQTAAISIAGSGDVAAMVTRSSNISIAGSGDVELTGGGKCSTSKVGSGNVTCS